MEYLEYDKLKIFTIIFLPGFISVKIYSLFIAEEKYDFSKNILEIIGYSLLNLAIFSWLILLDYYYNLSSNNSFLHFVLLFFILIIGPIIWPILFSYISKKPILRNYILDPNRTAWDSIFSDRESYYVILTMKDSKLIGGKYGLKSLASAYPHQNKIFIEEEWFVDDKYNFISPKLNSKGFLVVSDEILYIRFYQFN